MSNLPTLYVEAVKDDAGSVMAARIAFEPSEGATPFVPTSALEDLRAEVEALRRERDIAIGTDPHARIVGFESRAWCPNCGPAVGFDEDGLCTSCGVTAIGFGARRAMVALNAHDRLTREVAALTTRAEKAEAEQKKWEELALRACSVRDETTAERDEWKAKADAAVSRVAALEAALREVERVAENWRHPDKLRNMADADVIAGNALSGGTSALDVHDAALREEIAREVESHAEDVDSMHWRQAHRIIAQRIVAGADVLATIRVKGGK